MIGMQNAAYLQSEKNMPANLNALIRYRTIDKCLSNPYRKWTIEDLMEACSKALEESRGIYTGISERTIREDIRVMRSDILGFNAPIVQKDGNYSYEDRDYSIFNVSIQETDLLSRVLNFMLEIQSDIQHPDMSDIIKRITRAITVQKEQEELKKPAPKKDILSKELKSFRVESPELDLFPDEAEISGLEESQAMESIALTWANILNLIR
jgi:hypothetical protein